MNLKKHSKLDLVVFYVLHKLFSRWFKSSFSRKIFKRFFRILQSPKDKRLSNENLDSFSVEISEKLTNKGWMDIKKENFTKDILELRDHSIDAANNIFEGYFKLNPTGKGYLKGIDLSQYPEQVKLFNAFFTHPFFFNPIANYLGELPLLSELKLLYSPPTSFDEYSGSQLFHSDFDDSKLVKIFVFLEEVDEDMGPTEIIENKASELILKKTNYKWGVKRKKYSSHDDALKDVLGNKTNHISLMGPKGATYLIDTVACLHRGSRNPKKGRKILYANFTTRTSFRNPPINWLIHNDLTLKRSSPLIDLDPKGELNLKYIKNDR